MKSRESQLESAFLEGGVSVPGIAMRPFSLGTLNLCKRLKLSLFIEEDDGTKKAELSEDDTMHQLTTFAWMQTAPLPEVLAAVREDKWREKVELFAFDLSVDTVTALTSEIERIAGQSNAAAVKVAKKPGDTAEDKDAPPNS